MRRSCSSPRAGVAFGLVGCALVMHNILRPSWSMRRGVSGSGRHAERAEVAVPDTFLFDVRDRKELLGRAAEDQRASRAFVRDRSARAVVAPEAAACTLTITRRYEVSRGDPRSVTARI